MKKLLIGALLCAPLVATNAWAGGEKELYMSLECKTCHDPAKDQLSIGLGPSLQTIAKAYDGDEPALVQFLKGKAKPRISPENYMVMETQLAMILSGKPEDNLRKLAQFILSNKAPAEAPAPAAPPAPPAAPAAPAAEQTPPPAAAAPASEAAPK